MKVRILAAITLAAALCSGGCEEGGNFFSDIEGFINKEARMGEDLAPSVVNYTQREKERAKSFKSDLVAFTSKEKKERQELLDELHRFRTKELEDAPDLKVAKERAENSVTPRYFPVSEDY